MSICDTPTNTMIRTFFLCFLIALAVASPITKENPAPSEAKFARKDLWQGDIAGHEPWTRNVITDPDLKWPNGVVPYVIESGNFGAADLRIIDNAIEQFTIHTCVRFIPRTNERDYIHIFAEDGCWSYVGRIGGRQDVSLQNPGCVYQGIIQHEFSHALGIWHEQSRYDRDDHVEIQFQNIQSGYESNFEIVPEGESQVFGLPYDYGSVMHYGAYDFSISPILKTILTIPVANVPIGQRDGFSDVDIQKINTLYNC